jgi:hypothetical protein
MDTTIGIDNEFNINTITLFAYQSMISKYGIDTTWNKIIKVISTLSIEEIDKTLFKFDNLGNLYEIALEVLSKDDKKESGKYYTPLDVSRVMAELLIENENIRDLVDVGCGTGNLIIEVLDQLSKKKDFNLNQFILDKHIWLYDKDKLAVDICICKIELMLKVKVRGYINIVIDDFLDKKIKLPINCTVISNPPYSHFKDISDSWENTTIQKESKDLYPSFIEKIMTYCKKAVIVSPQSFLVSDKYLSLRKAMNKSFSGEIYSFDNVPATLFSGKKHGVFNSNTSNGVRASITVLRKEETKGFRLTHLIRFKSTQRDKVIDVSFLKSKLGLSIQDLQTPLKCFKELEPLINQVLISKHLFIKDLIEEDKNNQSNDYKIVISSSSRYFTLGCVTNLDRNGFYIVYAKNETYYKLLYSLLNSSYSYLWWRSLDGGILFTPRIFLSIPVPLELIDKVDELTSIVDEMIKSEETYFSYKMNAGKLQESIKFPETYRRKLNTILFPNFVKELELLHFNTESFPDK